MTTRTIAVVDDEPTVLKAISQSLASLDCSVSTFVTPLACLETIREKPFDVLISDINMPGMDGIALLKELKQIRPLMPVVLITGYGDIPLAVRAVKEGAFDFLEKPLDEQTFIPVIESALNEASASYTYEGENISEAEAKVLRLVAAGKSNKEIAYLLDRSIRTVENHRHRLMKKLKANSTADLVKIALALGMQ